MYFKGSFEYVYQKTKAILSKTSEQLIKINRIIGAQCCRRFLAKYAKFRQQIWAVGQGINPRDKNQKQANFCSQVVGQLRTPYSIKALWYTFIFSCFQKSRICPQMTQNFFTFEPPPLFRIIVCFLLIIPNPNVYICIQCLHVKKCTLLVFILKYF